MDNANNAVNVAVRVRPLLDEFHKNIVHKDEDTNVLFVMDKRNVFCFDKIFTENAIQSDVYEFITPLINNVLRGYNCTVLAYGQTGTGKTYTMGTDFKARFNTNNEEQGIIPRVLNDTFQRLEENPNINISVSFVEIYNEHVYDLLSERRQPLVVKGFQVQDRCIRKVYTKEEAVDYLQMGSRNRHVGHTIQNSSSSRSHAIFTIYYNMNGITSKFQLVDLAGSESARRTGHHQGKVLQEGVNINRGLFAIGKVISARVRGLKLVPYRESTLTMILQDSLNGNSYVTLLACISSSIEDLSETLNTLRMAQQIKNVKSRPLLNAIADDFEKTHPGVLASVDVYGTAKKQKTSITSSTVRKKVSNVAKNIFKNVPISPILQNTRESKKLEDASLLQESRLGSPILMGSMDDTQPVASSSVERPAECIASTISTTLKVVESANATKKMNGLLRKFSIAVEQTTNYLMNVDEEVAANLTGSHIIDILKRQIEDIPQSKSPDNFQRNIENISAMESDENKENITPECKKQLIFSNTSTSEKTSNADDDFCFKMPVPIRKQKASTTSLRRSKRLSLRHNITDECKNQSFAKDNDQEKLPVISDTSITSTVQVRRSMRLSCKMENSEHKIETLKNESSKSAEVLGDITNKISENAPIFKKTMPRRSLRQSILEIPKAKQTSWICKDESEILKCQQKKVLHILNYGKLKDIQSFSTIGPKTASLILNYRTLKGPFKSLEDIKNMPIWRGNAFNRFAESNMLMSETSGI